MAGKASATLNPTLLKRLDSLSKSRRVPREKLVDSAIRDYLRKAAAQRREARELTAAAGALAAYRQRDPRFEQAITAFVDAEASATDPVEGRTVRSLRPLRVSLNAILHG